MTSPDLPFGIWCWLGRRAAAGVQAGPSGGPLLAVFLDPVNLLVSIPPFPDGRPEMARFLRELARAADRMASEIYPTVSAHRLSGAHRLSSDDAVDRGDTGGGRP